MKIARRILAVAFFLAAFAIAYRFSGGNEQEVVVDLLFMTAPPTPLWLALVLAFSLGASGAALLLFYELGKLGLTTRRYRKTVASLESEIHQLRNLPLAADGGPDASTEDLEGRGSVARGSA